MNKTNEKNSIIICALAHIGDFIWATSAISLIKATNIKCKLTLLTFDNYVSLIDKKLGIDSIIKVNYKYFYSDKKYVRRIYQIFFYLKNYFTIKKNDTIIFLDQYKILSFFSKYIYKIKHIVGPNTFVFGKNIKNQNVKYYTDIINMPFDSDKTHIMIRYQIIIRNFINTYNLSLPILPNTDYLENKISKLIYKSKKYNIALCMFGNNKLNFWDIENWKQLINILNKTYNITFYIIGNTDKQYTQAEYLISKLPQNIDIRNICKKTTLLELSEFYKYINLLISIDTGTAHIASISKTPTITLHGPVLPEQSMPINHRAYQICLYKNCSPCYFGTCKKNICLSGIKPNDIFDIIQKMLILK